MADCGRGWSARCAVALGLECRCSCGGANHGSAHHATSTQALTTPSGVPLVYGLQRRDLEKKAVPLRLFTVQPLAVRSLLLHLHKLTTQRQRRPWQWRGSKGWAKSRRPSFVGFALDLGIWQRGSGADAGTWYQSSALRPEMSGVSAQVKADVLEALNRATFLLDPAQPAMSDHMLAQLNEILDRLNVSSQEGKV